MKTIAVVGCGAAGVILTLHLLNKNQSQLEIMLIDTSSKPGRGIAYETENLDFLLNVPSSKMGAYASQPDGFFNWLLYKGYAFKGLDFVPRKIYGDYLQDLLTEQMKVNTFHTVRILQDKVLAIHPDKKSTLHLESGQIIEADEVVLAIGNFPPRHLFPEGKRVYNHPWKNLFWEQIQSNQSLALVGTGLTALDYLVELHNRGHKGKIFMISRNGNFPLVHEEPCMQGLLKNYFQVEDSLRIVLRKINSIKRNPFLRIIRPVCVIEELRNLFPRMWYHWSVEERKMFYRRIFPIWNINRHRIPPQTAAVIADFLKTGQLQIIKGSVEKVNENENVEIICKSKNNRDAYRFQADFLVNCTGPEADLCKVNDPLLRQLFNNGYVLSDALHTGLVCNARMQLAGKDGIHSHFWGIGPILKSMFFESTAIHEIRSQAEALSNQLHEGADIHKIQVYSKV